MWSGQRGRRDVVAVPFEVALGMDEGYWSKHFECNPDPRQCH